MRPGTPQGAQPPVGVIIPSNSIHGALDDRQEPEGVDSREPEGDLRELALDTDQIGGHCRYAVARVSMLPGGRWYYPVFLET